MREQQRLTGSESDQYQMPDQQAHQHCGVRLETARETDHYRPEQRASGDADDHVGKPDLVQAEAVACDDRQQTVRKSSTLCPTTFTMTGTSNSLQNC